MIPLLFFLITWNQYEVVWTNDPGSHMVWISPENRTYEVQITTHTQRLERQSDVDLFMGFSRTDGFSLITFQGIKPQGAFNVKVEKKE